MTFDGSWKKRLESSMSSALSLVESEPGMWIQKYLKIQDKRGRLVPFQFNTIQRILYRKIRERWQTKRPVRLIVPKYRQGGVSTLVQALIFERVFRNANRNAAVIAHVDDAAANIFAMTSRFYDHMPADMQIPRRYASKQELVFEPPHESRYVVSTIRSGDPLGKSYTYQYIHGSEVASWADRGNQAKLAWVSITNAVPKSPDTMVILESTGHGRDPFFYAKIKRTLAPSYRGLYDVVFLPWYLQEDYRLPVTDAFQADEMERRLVDDVFDEAGFRIDNEQLEWRRRSIEDECEGDDGLFRRYFPSFLRECFEQTEHRFFAERTKSAYRRMARPPTSIGEMEGHPGEVKAEFAEERTGIIQVWEQPIVGHHYTMFSDVAEGGPGGDFDCAYVLHPETVSVVASVHGNRDTDDWAILLYLLGQWYNWALIAVENNSKPDVVRLLWREYKYPRLFWERNPAEKKRKTHRPGWNTNRRTRPLMLDILRNLCRKQALKCQDLGFAEEMDDFVWHETKRKFEAANGRHDDRIITMAGLLAVAGVDARIKAAEAEKKPKPDLGVRERYQLRKEKIRRQEREMASLRGGSGGLIVG